MELATPAEIEAMHRCLALGAGVRRTTAPNPWIGTVILDPEGRTVGEGATQPPGGPHSEIEALRAAGEAARGATLVVSLEPCSHVGRTGPCTDAIIDAGIARVVVAMADPDPHVAGDGIIKLRDAGIDVVVGVETEAAVRALAPYLHHRRTGRAYALLKSATSVDGRTAAADGSSRWITGAQARADAHQLRAESQAVLIGANTAVADAPELTVREAAGPYGPPPLRVVLDSRGRVPATGPLFETDVAPTLIVTTEEAPPEARHAWEAAGAEYEVVPAVPGGVDLRVTLERLGARGVVQVLVEGGATVHGAFVRSGLANGWIAYVAPVFLGEDAAPLLAGPGPERIGDALRWRTVDARRLGDDVRIDLEPLPDEPLQ